MTWRWVFGALVLVACDSDEAANDPFTLRFAAVVDDHAVGCADVLTGFGPGGADAVALNDLRFYVSGLRFLDANGKEVPLSLEQNELQYRDAHGAVALVDLTGTSEGGCAGVAGGEGTDRTNLVITGKTDLARVHSVAFDVGVPQPLMQSVIAGFSAEGAPSPLNEMYWSWNSGYRHFVMNFSVTDASDVSGGGFVHIGSRDCGDGEGKALADRAACTYVNTPTVMLADFDPTSDTVGLDLRKVLAGVDFRSPIYDPTTFEVIGEGPGVECHSSPDQPDCGTLFSSFGLDMDDGSADPGADQAFVRLR